MCGGPASQLGLVVNCGPPATRSRPPQPPAACQRAGSTNDCPSAHAAPRHHPQLAHDLVAEALQNRDDNAALERIRGKVRELTRRFPLPS